MKVWLVTGGTSGFGLALANAAVEAGEVAVALARSSRRGTDELGTGVEHLPCDVTVDEQVRSAVEQVLERHGRIDVLANCAGGTYRSTVEEGEPTAIADLFAVNVFGTAAAIRAVLPSMRMRGAGAIVNFSSLAGLVGFAGSGYYSATKFAVEGLSEALRDEVAPLGIQVLLVEPSGFRTGASQPQPGPAAIEDYAATAGKLNAFLDAARGREPAPYGLRRQYAQP